MIHGGDWPSTVAGECVTHCRLALYPGERVDALKARVEKTVAAVAAEPTRLAACASTSLYEGFQCEGYELAPDAPLITALADAAARANGAGAAAVRLHRHDRRAHLPALRRHARGVLRRGAEPCTASTSACTCRRW